MQRHLVPMRILLLGAAALTGAAGGSACTDSPTFVDALRNGSCAVWANWTEQGYKCEDYDTNTSDLVNSCPKACGVCGTEGSCPCEDNATYEDAEWDASCVLWGYWKKVGFACEDWITEANSDLLAKCPHACGICVDRDECIGACEDNATEASASLPEECRSACGDCPPRGKCPCGDDPDYVDMEWNVSCAVWGTWHHYDGYRCEDYMTEANFDLLYRCPKACGQCTRDGQCPVPCKDDPEYKDPENHDASCLAWAVWVEDGYKCEDYASNASELLDRCRESCGVCRRPGSCACKDDPEYVDPEWTASCTLWAEWVEEGYTCEDYITDANIDLLYKCQEACGRCRRDDQCPEACEDDPDYVDQQWKGTCEIWAGWVEEGYECEDFVGENNSNLLEKCPKACGVCPPPRKCPCGDDPYYVDPEWDVSCATWAVWHEQDGYMCEDFITEANSDLLYKCGKACGLCPCRDDPDYVDPSSQGTCEDWVVWVEAGYKCEDYVTEEDRHLLYKCRKACGQCPQESHCNEACSDDPTYVDPAMNATCSRWALWREEGFKCEDYTTEANSDLLCKCRKTCGRCQYEDVCPCFDDEDWVDPTHDVGCDAWAVWRVQGYKCEDWVDEANYELPCRCRQACQLCSEDHKACEPPSPR